MGYSTPPLQPTCLPACNPRSASLDYGLMAVLARVMMSCNGKKGEASPGMASIQNVQGPTFMHTYAVSGSRFFTFLP